MTPLLHVIRAVPVIGAMIAFWLIVSWIAGGPVVPACDYNAAPGC